MEKLKFVFNEEKVRQSGSSVTEIMKPIREYLFTHGIKELEPFVFAIDGTDSESVFTALIVKLTRDNYGFINLLNEWTLDSDDGTEDCIQETKDWYKRRGILCSA